MRSPLRSAVGWAAAGLLMAFLFFPLLVVVPSSLGAGASMTFPPRELSLRWYGTLVADPRWLGSAALSAQLALGAGLVVAAIGLSLGIVHLRSRSLGDRFQMLLLLPALIPHVILASGLFTLELWTRSLESLPLLLFAQATLGIPYGVLLVLTAVRSIDPLLWTAASTLGAAGPTIVRRVMLPVLAPSVAIAGLFGFHASWDDVAIAALTGPAVTPTLPVRMYLYLSDVFTPLVAAAATMLLTMSALVAVGAWLLQRRLIRLRAAPERAASAVAADLAPWPVPR